MVDADQGPRGLAELLDQPFRDAAPGSIPARRSRRQDLDRQPLWLGHIDAQARQAGVRRLRAGVVWPNSWRMPSSGFNAREFSLDLVRYVFRERQKARLPLSALEAYGLKLFVRTPRNGKYFSSRNKRNIQKIWRRRTPGDPVLGCCVFCVIRRSGRLLKRGKMKDRKPFDTCFDGAAGDVLHNYGLPQFCYDRHRGVADPSNM